MALKGDRLIAAGGDDISYFMNVAATAGTFVVHKALSTGVGAAMDDPNAQVVVPTGGVSGTKPAGVLQHDVVNIDLTRQPLNRLNNEVYVGGKVCLVRHGQLTLNNITGTPSPGDSAYFNSSGNLQPTNPTNGTIVGRFLSGKDADGYAKVEINITGN